jgi:hypothetical protein
MGVSVSFDGKMGLFRHEKPNLNRTSQTALEMGFFSKNCNVKQRLTKRPFFGFWASFSLVSPNQPAFSLSFLYGHKLMFFRDSLANSGFSVIEIA